MLSSFFSTQNDYLYWIFTILEVPCYIVIYICIHTHTHTYICVSIHTHTHIYIYLHLFICYATWLAGSQFHSQGLTWALALKAPSPNRWTARECPPRYFFFFLILSFIPALWGRHYYLHSEGWKNLYFCLNTWWQGI